MKSVPFSLLCCSAILLSCSKDEETKASGPTVTTPGLSLVAGDNFKNTASGAEDVSAKLKSGADGFKSTEFGPSASNAQTNDKRGVGILGSATVTSFLNVGPTTPSQQSPSKMKIGSDLNLTTEDGAGCGENLQFIQEVYSDAGANLYSAAEQLVAIDQNLPDGVVNTGATDQFAVSYQIDLSKVTVDESRSGSGSSSANLRQTNDLQLSGVAKIGAGANSEAAVIALGLNLGMQSEGATGSFAGGFAVSVNDAQKLLKLSSDGNIGANFRADNGEPVSGNLSYNGLVELQAGDNPSIHLSASMNGNAKVSSDGAEASNTTHASSLDIKVAQTSTKNVQVTYKITADGKTQSGSMDYLTDSSQNQGCVISRKPAGI